MLLPSVLGLALCMVCLAATTWAWFTASVTSGANTIQTASFDVNVAVTNGANTVNAVDGIYTLPTGEYTVTMSKTGDANGYFDFKVGEKQYRTTAITANTPITVTIQNNRTSPIICSFTSYWGTPDGTTNVDNEIVTFNAVLPPEIISIADGETIIVGEPPEEPTDESEQENQQQEEENPSDENNPADDSENNGEEGGASDTSTDTSTDGDGNEEQQGDEPSTPADGEGEQTDVSGDTTGGDISDDTTTGGETPTDTTTPTGGDVPTEPVVATDPTAQSEGGAPADPVATE